MKRLTTLAAGAAVVIAIAACGSGTNQTGSSPKTLNGAKVAKAIAASILSQRHLRAVVSCPTGVPLKAGARFWCVAQIGTTDTPFHVTEPSPGRVSYDGVTATSAPLLDTDAVAQAIAASVKARTGKASTVECPTDIPRQPGLRFFCVGTSATSSKAAARTTDFEITETNDHSGFRYAIDDAG